MIGDANDQQKLLNMRGLGRQEFMMKGKICNRRAFLAAFGAMPFVFAGSARAHQEPPFEMPKDYLPTLVDLQVTLSPGMIHVFPDQFRLYLTLPDNQALRYTVGVGRPGLYHAGQFTIGAKREWPSWRPTPAMIERNPDAYAQYADGVPGGVDNPLGARALYLFNDAGQDTALRIHGTNQPRTIGTAVSNGCARLTNEHITDLYDRVSLGAQVFLHAQIEA